jgi:hypothetical protein
LARPAIAAAEGVILVRGNLAKTYAAGIAESVAVIAFESQERALLPTTPRSARPRTEVDGDDGVQQPWAIGVGMPAIRAEPDVGMNYAWRACVRKFSARCGGTR